MAQSNEVNTVTLSRGHSFGFASIQSELSDLIDLAITLLEGDK
ncbi:hypothetical protein J2S20_002269 [Moryella indoligenes]|uniref:Uncharacterized protein n=1 Tax=Moryella indoligenes TaxID=371674 RepID=A0AAE4AL22_9FIRM|nr:hypothetical protein [Moryella indoligenes]